MHCSPPLSVSFYHSHRFSSIPLSLSAPAASVGAITKMQHPTLLLLLLPVLSLPQCSPHSPPSLLSPLHYPAPSVCAIYAPVSHAFPPSPLLPRLSHTRTHPQTHPVRLSPPHPSLYSITIFSTYTPPPPPSSCPLSCLLFSPFPHQEKLPECKRTGL